MHNLGISIHLFSTLISFTRVLIFCSCLQTNMVYFVGFVPKYIIYFRCKYVNGTVFLFISNLSSSLLVVFRGATDFSILIFFILCGNRSWTQGLTLGKQVLYHLNHSNTPKTPIFYLDTLQLFISSYRVLCWFFQSFYLDNYDFGKENFISSFYPPNLHFLFLSYCINYLRLLQ
jgi:hypothetical protein